MCPFDEHAVQYDQWFSRNTYTYASELKLLRSLIPKNKRGLEVGVGTGRFAIPLHIHEGVDVSADMLRFAKLRGVQACLAPAERLPFPAETFDVVLVVTSICFFKNITKAFLEMRRVLKPRGSLIIGFVDKNSFLGRAYVKRKSKSIFYEHARFYSVKDVLRILERSKFDLVSVKQTLFSFPEDILALEPVRDGHGLGGFVGIKARK